ncbi:MAG: 3-hydroxyacyl-CoA dehydrogenase family protein [Acidobacteriota bacterium]
MKIRKVGVAGCGLMGSGIAQVAAQAGFETTVREVDQALLDKGLHNIDRFLAKGVERGKIQAADREKVMGRIRGTTDLAALASCDIVIEAIVEDREAKRRFFTQLDSVCGKETVFASNTSSLSITDLATSTSRPERFLGLHFFNPVPLMPLLEVVRTLLTDSDIYETALAFGRELGKTPVRASDKTGFIVNRLLVPYLLDAVRALAEGIGSITDIDAGMKLGCGYPMGPFTLLDLVGLDTTASIAEIFFQEFREPRYATPSLLRRMVLAGFHGKKSGRGFYDYSGEKPRANDFLWKPEGRN